MGNFCAGNWKNVRYSLYAEQVKILTKRLKSPNQQLNNYNGGKNNIKDSSASMKSSPVNFIVYSEVSLEG